MNKKNISDIVNFRDYLNIIFIIPIILSLFGIIIVASATSTMSDGGIRKVIVQIFGFLLGCACVYLISKINFWMLKHFGLYFFLFSFFLLLLVLFIGKGGEELGSNSWINIGFISFQPSELVKIFFIMICAVFLERIKRKQDTFINYIKLAIYAGSLVALVLLQKDFGTAAVFIFIFIVMIFITGVSRKLIVSIFSLLLLAIPFAWFFVLNDSRKERIIVFFNPESDPLNAGFNVIQSKLAIGSGQLFGQGLFKGFLNTRELVPVKESDFIFAVVGEELGFAGTIFVVVLFAVLLFAILQAARKTTDTFLSLVCYGVFALFAFHFVENVAMTVGLLPVTGIPLPFISAGGTALVSYFIAIGIVMSISNRSGPKRTV